RAAEKVKLLDSLDKIMDTGTVARSPVVSGYYETNLGAWARGLAMSFDAKIAASDGVGVEGLAKKTYENNVHQMVKDYVTDTGEMPKGAALRQIMERAEEKARRVVAETIKGAPADGVPTPPPAPAPTPEGQQATATVRPDGVIDLRKKQPSPPTNTGTSGDW
ncbi:hypothetical protein WDZ92_34885, partial [Nostoc sp. NIES-2111]